MAMGKSNSKKKKTFNKLLNQLKEDQYLEIDDAIINVVNKKTKNVIVSIDIFSDYEKDSPYEEEIESIDGTEVLVTEAEESSVSEYKPMILVYKETTETTKEPYIDESTGEPMYDRDGNALYSVVEEPKREEIVIDTAQVVTENIYIPPGVASDEPQLITTPVIKIEPGSWYYIKLQLEEAFKINQLKKAIEEFEAMAPVVIGMPVPANENLTEYTYYTLQEVLDIHRNAIKNCPNTFWQDGDILHIGYYGDNKYEFKITIDPGDDKREEIPVTDIQDPAYPDDPTKKMQICDRNGKPIYNVKVEEGQETSITVAIVITGERIIDDYGEVIEDGWRYVRIDDDEDKGTQKVSYFYTSTIEFLANKVDDEDSPIRNLFSDWSMEDGSRYIAYPEDGEDEFEESYDKSGENFAGFPHLTKHGDEYEEYAHGYRFIKGDVKQVRHGGTFKKYDLASKQADLNTAKQEAIKNNKNVDIIETAYAKINVGDYKAWENLTSKDIKSFWAEYLAKMAITTDSVKNSKDIPVENTFNFYRVHTAYIKCMTKILINMGFADWNYTPDKSKKNKERNEEEGYTHDKNYIIETDLESFASIDLEEVEETLEKVISDANDLVSKLDQVLYGYTKYDVSPAPGFQTQYDEVQLIFSSLQQFANRYWGIYRKGNNDVLNNGYNLNDNFSIGVITKLKKNSSTVYFNTQWGRTNWEYSTGMFLFYIMMYQAYLFYAISLKTSIDIVKQIQEYLSFDQAEYNKWIKNKLFVSKVKKGDEISNVYVTDDKGKKYSRKSNSFKNANKKLKKLFKNHFLTYYTLILNLFDLDDYVTNKFMIQFNKTYKKPIAEYEKIPKEIIITDKKSIEHYQKRQTNDRV